MTDEEKADKYEFDCIADVGRGEVCDLPYAYSAKILERAYLDGLIEGRKEKWHDLRKDPNDLPKHSGLYCVQSGEVREYVKEEKSWFTVHFDPCMNRTEETYLWCELTKFEE